MTIYLPPPAVYKPPPSSPKSQPPIPKPVPCATTLQEYLRLQHIHWAKAQWFLYISAPAHHKTPISIVHVSIPPSQTYIYGINAIHTLTIATTIDATATIIIIQFCQMARLLSLSVCRLNSAACARFE